MSRTRIPWSLARSCSAFHLLSCWAPLYRHRAVSGLRSIPCDVALLRLSRLACLPTPALDLRSPGTLCLARLDRVEPEVGAGADSDNICYGLAVDRAALIEVS